MIDFGPPISFDNAHPNTHQAALWNHIYGDTPGMIAAFSGRRVTGKQDLQDTASRYFEWPKQSTQAMRWLQGESNRGRCAYVCAHLVTKKRRIKENAAPMLALYVDGDGAEVPAHLPQPTVRVQSSPGREQDYWRLTRSVDPATGEALNRRLAYAMGADKSGWDLTQLLRAVGTQNWKYKPAPYVKVISIEDAAYDPDDLDRMLPALPDEVKPRAEVKLGQATTATPIGDRDQRVRERMYASKRGSEIQMLAAGGSVMQKPGGGADVSGDDLSYANALAFWFDKDSARMAAEMWRSNRVRDKWIEIHSAKGETYLEMTIGTAISACRQSFRELTGYDAGDEPPVINWFTKSAPEEPVPTEAALCPCSGNHTACIEIRELRESNRDLIAWVERLAGLEEDRQNVITSQRRELEDKTAFLSLVTEVLAKPNDEMACAEKIVFLAMTYETHYRADRGRTKLPLIALQERTGLSKNIVSKHSRAITARPGSVFERSVTREVRQDEEGNEQWVTTIEVVPKHERVEDTIRTYLALPKAPDKPKHGGSAEAVAAREHVRRCPKHRDADVIIRGACSACDADLGQDQVTAEAWDGLNRQVGDSVPLHPPVDVKVLSSHQVGDSAPVSLLDYAASRPQERPIECPAPGCGAMEFRPVARGWRCLKSGHDPSLNLCSTVAGGSE